MDIEQMFMEYGALVLHSLVASALFTYGASRVMPKKVSFNKKTVVGFTLMVLSVLLIKAKYF
jgi:hypothetical protein